MIVGTTQRQGRREAAIVQTINGRDGIGEGHGAQAVHTGGGDLSRVRKEGKEAAAKEHKAQAEHRRPPRTSS